MCYLFRVTSSSKTEFNSSTSSSIAPQDSLLHLEMDRLLFRQDGYVHPDYDIGQILDPFEDRGESNGAGKCNVTSTIEYRNGLLVRVVYIPALVLLLLSSCLLLYILLTLLKPLLKIYLSVIFYAICQLLLAACLLLSLLSSRLFSPTDTSCSVTEPLYNVAMILPGYAVLAITIVRYTFLNSPMTWRNLLRTPYQLAGLLIN